MRDWEQIETMGHDFMASRVLLSAVELDLFTILGAEERTAGEVAQQLGTDPRATGIFLDAAAALELLEKREDRYSNTAITGKYLDTASPDYRGGMLRHSVNLWESWSRLTDVVRTGLPHERVRTETSGRDFILAMHHSGWEVAQQIAEVVDLSDSRRLLDLGGGPGSYAIAFCRRYPGLKAVLYDLPYALEIAKEIVAEHGMSSRIELVAGDFLQDPIPDGFDYVWISSIVHSYGDEDNRKIIRRAAGSLIPGGKLAIREFVLEPDRIRPVFAALFAINMLVNTPEGRSYTGDEITQWMTEAGLRDIRRINPEGNSVIFVGTRPK